MKKLIIFLILICLVFINAAYAKELNNNLSKRNALAIKVGEHLYEENDFMDFYFWEINKDEMRSIAFEFSYERKLTRMFGIEMTVGFFESNEELYDRDKDSAEIKFENYYFSPTLKYYVPINDSFGCYFGVGPDVYYNKGEYTYNHEEIRRMADDSSTGFGFHGLIGAEWYFYDSVKYGYFDAPVSLLFEYKYSHVKIKDAHEAIIDEIGKYPGLSLGNQDFDVGGHMLFLGLRWHF